MELIGVIMLCVLGATSAELQPPWQGLQISRYANANEDGYFVTFLHSAGNLSYAPNNSSLLQLFKSFQQLYPNNALDHVIGFDVTKHTDRNNEANQVKTVLDHKNKQVKTNGIGIDVTTVDHEVTTDVSQRLPLFKNNNEESDRTEQTFIESLFVHSCDEIKQIRTDSVRTVIVGKDITCAADIYRVVNSTHGLLIISTDNQPVLTYMRNISELFEFDDTSILNQLKYPGMRSLGVNIYFATHDIIAEMIFESVSKNDKTHFNKIIRKLLSKNACKLPVQDAMKRLVAEKHTGLLILGYWIKNNFQSAANDCMPNEIEFFYNNSRQIRIMNHDKSGLLEMKSSDTSISINCTINNQYYDEYKYWQVHQTPTNNYFRFLNHGVDLKAGEENEFGERQVVSDRLVVNAYYTNLNDFLWRFEVAGSNADGDILFCVFYKEHGQLLASDTCESDQPLQVKLKDGTCGPNSAWIFVPEFK